MNMDIIYLFGNKDNSINSSYKSISKWHISYNNNLSSPISFEFVMNFQIELDGLYQGHKYKDGFLYVGFSNNTSPYNSKMVKLDLENKCVVKQYDFSIVSKAEFEGICYTQNKWYYSDMNKVYEVKFRT